MTDQRASHQAPTLPITIYVTQRVFEGLRIKARAVGMAPTTYAGLLFSAGYAARCGKAEGDLDLQAAVDLVTERLAARAAAAAAPRAVVTVAPAPAPCPATVVAAPAPLPHSATPAGARFVGLSDRESIVLALLRRDEGVSTDEMCRALQRPGEDRPPRSVAQAMVSNVRIKLARLAPGAGIEVVVGWGWRMSTSARARVDAMGRRTA